jgi:hemerythrin
MGFLEWSEEFEFGIPEIDGQHKRMLDVMNTFYDGLEKQDHEQHLLGLLDDVLDYVRYHFEEEERILAVIGYPSLGEQEKLHAVIDNKIQDFKDRIIEEKPISCDVVTTELGNWYRNHILNEDKKYVALYKRTLRNTVM